VDAAQARVAGIGGARGAVVTVEGRGVLTAGARVAGFDAVAGIVVVAAERRAGLAVAGGDVAGLGAGADAAVVAVGVSSQQLDIAVWLQPVTASQLSLVQTMPSSQSSGVAAGSQSPVAGLQVSVPSQSRAVLAVRRDVTAGVRVRVAAVGRAGVGVVAVAVVVAAAGIGSEPRPATGSHVLACRRRRRRRERVGARLTHAARVAGPWPSQTSPLSHWASLLQQPAMPPCVHMSVSASQASAVQTTPSSQVGGVPSSLAGGGVTGSRPSQKTPSSQIWACRAAPSAQVSSSVQRLPSSQARVVGDRRCRCRDLTCRRCTG
jgi:hypothetical protein